MKSDDYFDLMLRTMRRDATYSSRRQAWITPLMSARIFFRDQWEELPAEFASIEDIIEEGTRRGFWEMDATTHVLLMK